MSKLQCQIVAELEDSIIISPNSGGPVTGSNRIALDSIVRLAANGVVLKSVLNAAQVEGESADLQSHFWS